MAVPIFMIISGYVNAMSFFNKNVDSIEKAYNIKLITKKIIRFVIPFTIAFLLEVCLVYIRNIYFEIEEYSLSPISLILRYMEGGYGPGSYYFPIMIQFIFLFPVIYFVISKYKTKGLIISGVLNISFEIFKNIINMNVDLYRLLVFRYIFIIAFGAYVYIEDDKRKLNIINVLLFLIGIVFNILITYNFYSPIIFNCWTSTCMFASFLICFVVSMCIERVNIKSKCIELVSDSSFNIFLVQMVWFKFGQSIFCDTINNLFLRLLLSVIVCVIVGIIFRYIEKPITKKIANYLN